MDKNYKSDYQQPFHIFFYQKRIYFGHNMTSKFEMTSRIRYTNKGIVE